MKTMYIYMYIHACIKFTENHVDRHEPFELWYIYIYTHSKDRVYTNICMFIYIYIYIYIHTLHNSNMYIHEPFEASVVFGCLYLKGLHLCMCVYIYVCTYVRMCELCVYMHEYLYVCMYECMYIRMYVYHTWHCIAHHKYIYMYIYIYTITDMSHHLAIHIIHGIV
jgi:hypothetical protein